MSNYVKYLFDINAGRESANAFVDSTGYTTYSEWRVQSTAIAHYYQAQGLGAGDFVILAAKHNRMFPIVFTALVSLGIIPLLVDETADQETLTELSARICAKATITTVDVEQLPTAPVSDIKFHDYQPDDLAFMLCTSGTTGVPKLVKHKHRAFFDIYQSTRGRYGLCQQDVVMATAKMSFGYGFALDIIVAPQEGCMAVLIDKPPTPNLVIDNIKTHQVTHFFSNPTMLGLLVNKSGATTLGNDIRYVITSSEPISDVIVEKFKAKFGIALLNGYGSSETMINTIINDDTHSRPGSMGKPIDGFEFVIHDKDNNECAIGIPGILMVRSPMISCEYYGQEHQANEHFPMGWFKTNDVAYQDLDGFYYYIGRNGQHVKINAMWTSAAEIENLLLSTNKISDATVTFAHDDNGLTKAIAYVVLDNAHQTVTTAQLRGELLTRAKAHQVPKEVYFMQSLPRSKRNKRITNKQILDAHYADQS
jgi:benzoate-CoA ligase